MLPLKVQISIDIKIKQKDKKIYKIAFKNLLVPKNLLYSNTEEINIQTIKIDKDKNYLK